MNIELDNQKRHFFQMKIQNSTKIHLDAKAKHGVYPCWPERRSKDNQGESRQCLEDRFKPLLEVTISSANYYQGGTILRNEQDSTPLIANFTSLPNINKLQCQSTSFTKAVNCHSTLLPSSSSSKQSTVITSKSRSDHHHHHRTPIAPYRRLPLSYRQSAKKIARKSNRLFDNSLYSDQKSSQLHLHSTPSSPTQDPHHEKQEDQSKNRSIKSEEMNKFNPLCAEIPQLPTIESADEAFSLPSTPITTSSGHHRQGSIHSARRSSTALSMHGESYRSLKGKGNKNKSFSAWDEEEGQKKKSPSKSLSKWKNLGASNRVEKKKAKNDVPLMPKSILNNSVSSIDLSSKENCNSPVVSPKEQGEKLRKIGSLTPLKLRTSEPDFNSNSFGTVLQGNGSMNSLSSTLMKGTKPSFEIQTRQTERFTQRSATMQEGDQPPSEYNCNQGATPPSPRYPSSIASSKKISSTLRAQAKVTSGEPPMGSSTIQSTLPSPMQEILWDSKRKKRNQTCSTFSSGSASSKNAGAEFITSTENALLQCLQSPIGSLDTPSPSPNLRRVSKNFGVQNIRKTATKLQEALRESDENEEAEVAKETVNSANVIESLSIESPSSHNSSMNAAAPSSIFMAPTHTTSDSIPIMFDQLQAENSASSHDTTREQVADHNQPRERREVAYSPRGKDLESYNKFLNELQADLGPTDDQDDADSTITAIKQAPLLNKTRRHRSSTTHKDQLFASEKTQIAIPRRSCASLTVEKPISTSSKTSISSYSDSDEIATNEYEPSQSCPSETGSSNMGGIQRKNEDQEGESEDRLATHDEEVLQSSVDSSVSYSTIDQTTDAQMEILDCRIQSVRRFDMSASVPPSPRIIRCDSQQSLLSQAKLISKEEQDQKRDSLPSISHCESTAPSETSFNQSGTQSISCKDCRVQSVDVKTGSSETNVAVTLNWTSMIDSSTLNTTRGSHIVHGKLQLEESEVERIARAWIDTQLGQTGHEQALSSTEGLRKASEQLSLGLTEEEIRQVNKSVMEQRQREILASAFASNLHNRDQIREKMASEIFRMSTTSSEDSCKQRRRSLHLKPDQFQSPGLFIDTESTSLSESILSKRLSSSPNRFHPMISPVSTTSSARQSFNSIASYKRLSPKKLRE